MVCLSACATTSHDSGFPAPSELPGGMIEHVYIRDVEVGLTDSLVIFTNDYHSYRGGNHPARIDNVTINGVAVNVTDESDAESFDAELTH